MKNLPIKLENNEPVISTLDIAKGIEGEHKVIINLVRTFKKDLESIRFFDFLKVKIKSKKSKEKRGRKTSYCFLNEEQSIFLVTLMRNSSNVVAFKKKLSRDFMRMRKQLIAIEMQKTDPDWIAQRKAGKLVHLQKTDIIKEFIEYAKAQGGSVKGCERYYSNIATMENKALFILEQKFKNLRNILNLNQLATVTSADNIARKAIREAMADSLHYKDIYQLAKKRVETFAELHGKTFIPTIQARIEA